MKRNILCFFLLSAVMLPAIAQVTRLSDNTSYDWGFALTNTKIMLRSAISKTIWVYDVPGNSFTQLNATVMVEADYDYGVMGGKLYFAGKTVAEGIELWVSDGTPGGTSLLKDINTAGAADSDPKYGFIEYNSELYFTANDGTTGRELWKTNGTGPGTVQVKDINTGVPDAFTTTTLSGFKVINSVLVFSATTAADGDELWKTDGTGPGTIQLKNINTFAGLGSNISGFTEYGTNLIFKASDLLTGDAIWKTDGTIPGTVLLKDIDPGPSPISISPFFFNFQNELYFSADDGTTGYELWKTNGTDVGTVLVKDIDPGDDGGGNPNNGLSIVGLILAVKNSSKFFFTATTAVAGTELWQSDGTGPGTTLLKDIASGITSSNVQILPNFFGNALFQGNKFFFIANTPGVEGNEFYVSDGTSGGTTLLKDINPGPASGFDGINLSWFYTDNKFFFVANNGINGTELWQSDGTNPGTTLVADVNPTAPPGDADSDISFSTIASGTLFFFGTDGNDAVKTDFFKLDAAVTTLPLRWISIEAGPQGNDVLLLWKTAVEEQTDYFVVQRSIDGINYRDIGLVNATGAGTNNYRFTDIDAMLKTGINKWFYRVMYIDKDGSSAISKIVTVALKKGITQIRLLPNPARNELNLVIDAPSNVMVILQVVTMEGKLVLHRSLNINRGENNVISDVGHLPDGVYMLKVNMGGAFTTERFLIQR